MKKRLFIVFALCFSTFNAQFFQHIAIDNVAISQDTTSKEKSTNYEAQRSFNENLIDKYNDKEFTYTEEKYKEPKKESAPSPFWNFFAQILAGFMRFVFPFLLGGFIIFLILKAALGVEGNWFSFKKTTKNAKEKLVYEEDADIENENLEELLQSAIQSENYRLAIRFYFLIVLKELSQQKLIDYHKDKTNTEYLFELKNVGQKEQFSYLLYLYNYIWYGEFAISQTEFQLAENEYQSFKKSLI